jgi:hypothetical protein
LIVQINEFHSLIHILTVYSYTVPWSRPLSLLPSLALCTSYFSGHLVVVRTGLFVQFFSEVKEATEGTVCRMPTLFSLLLQIIFSLLVVNRQRWNLVLEDRRNRVIDIFQCVQTQKPLWLLLLLFLWFVYILCKSDGRYPHSKEKCCCLVVVYISGRKFENEITSK